MRALVSACRRSAREPLASLLGAGTVALGTAATAVLFSLLYAVAIARLPFPEADRPITIRDRRLDTSETVGASPGRYQDWKARLAPLVTISAMWPGLALNGRNEDAAFRVNGAYADAGFVEMLGRRPGLGRGLDARDVVPDAPPVILLSDAMWRSLGGDPSIVGRHLTLDGIPHEVVGVAPPDLTTPAGDIDVWLPLRLTVWNRVSRNLIVLGRLRGTASAADVSQALGSAQAAAATAYPETDAKLAPVVEDLHATLAGPAATSVRIVFAGSAALVGLIAINLGALFVARVSARRRDIAIERALGASARQIVWAALVEGLVLVTAGMVAGLLLAWATLPFVGALVASVGASPLLAQGVAFSWPAFYAAACVAVLVTIGATLGPAALALRITPFEVLRARQPAVGAHLRQALVAVEIAGAAVLLVTAVLLTQTARTLGRADLGLNVDDVITARLWLPTTTHGPADVRRDVADRLVGRLASVPGVRSVAIGSALPFGGAPAPFNLRFMDAPDVRQQAEHRSVGPGYFEALGIRLFAGRAFNSFDRKDSPQVAMVSASLAARVAAGVPGSIVGRRLSIDGPDGPWREIVGVVADTRYATPGREGQGELYLPWTQDPWRQLVVVLKHAPGAAPTGAELSRAFADIDPQATLYDIMPLRTRVHASLGLQLLLERGFLGFAALTLALALLGIYALFSWTVAMRRVEFGVRLALGATPAGVGGSVGVTAARLLAAGLAVGAPVAWVTARLLTAALPDMARLDPATFASSLATLAASAFLAAAGPMWRASRTDAAAALRGE